jgi:hypothetical protein
MTSTGSYEIHSEARGSHWIAWIGRNGDPKPHGAVVVVGQTQAEAEARALADLEARKREKRRAAA